MADLIGKIAMALIVLTFAGMVLRNTKGTGQVINTTLGGYGNLLATARGSS